MVADGDAAAERQLSVDATAAVGAPGSRVHLAEDVGQPSVTDRTFRRGSAAMLVVARLRDVQQPAAGLHGETLTGHHIDRPRIAFWARRLLEQLGGTSMDLDLGLEPSDPTPSRGQLRLLRRREARDRPARIRS